MSAIVSSETISGETDHRLFLSIGQWAGKMSFGNAWNTLRVAARITFTPSLPGGLIDTPKFWIGVMTTPTANLANGMLVPTSDSHFWGLETASPSWADSGDEFIWTFDGGIDYIRQLGVGFSIIQPSVFGTLKYISKLPAIRSFIVVDFIRDGSGNLGIQACIPSETGDFDDVLAPLFYRAMNSFPLTAWRDQTNGTFPSTLEASASVPVDEDSYGPLNSVYVGWARGDCTLNLSEVLFCRKD